uniref:Uncharacterized protein n=1 Tax=Cacopsylla melanoneura TaxID=428564 RepID=A0A8D8LEU4_9HEMI
MSLACLTILSRCSMTLMKIKTLSEGCSPLARASTSSDKVCTNCLGTAPFGRSYCFPLREQIFFHLVYQTVESGMPCDKGAPKACSRTLRLEGSEFPHSVLLEGSC